MTNNEDKAKRNEWVQRVIDDCDDNGEYYMYVTRKVEQLLGILPIKYDEEDYDYHSYELYFNTTYTYELDGRTVRVITEWDTGEINIEYWNETHTQYLSIKHYHNSYRSSEDAPFLYILEIIYFDDENNKFKFDQSFFVDIFWNLKSPLTPEVFQLPLIKKLRGE